MQIAYSYIILSGAALLFVGQFYFRFKVMKSLQELSKKNIGLRLPHIINKRRLYEEVISQYPNEEAILLTTVCHIQVALLFTLGMVLIMGIAFWLMLQQ